LGDSGVFGEFRGVITIGQIFVAVKGFVKFFINNLAQHLNAVRAEDCCSYERSLIDFDSGNACRVVRGDI
jgi:hypothetical protein